MLHGMLVGPITPTYEARHAIEAPTLVIGHQIDFIHPFTDADHLARQLQHATLLEARSILELRIAPERLTAEIAEFLDDTWARHGPGAAAAVGRRLSAEAPGAEAPGAEPPGAQRRGSQASGSSVSLATERGRRPATMSSRLTRSSTLRRLARTATHTSWRCSAAPVVVRRLGAQAPYLGQGPVEGPHDVGHADLLGRPGQAVATLGRRAGWRRCRPGAAR